MPGSDFTSNLVLMTSSNSRTAPQFRAQMLIKPIVFLLSLMPLALAILKVSQDALGANPSEALLHITGEWSLRFLLLTLAVTPLQLTLKWGYVAKLRRMLGLFAFFYAVLHLLIWVVLEQELDLAAAVKEVIEKKFILLGMTVLLGMLPLALTSNRWSVRKLGVKWKALHRWIYPLSVLAVVHFLWQVRANDVLEPAMYLAVLLVLLGWRFARLMRG